MPVDLIRRQNFDETKSAVVILQVLDTIQGGVTLDTTGFTADYIEAGHVLIQETATGVVKPLGFTGANFDALPEDHAYYGISLTTVQTSEPFVGVLVQGAVNYKAMPYNATSILTALRTALNNVEFRSDK